MSDAHQVVAIIGLGRMGSAMAGRIAAGGFDLVLHNRDRSKAEAVRDSIGGVIAASPAEAASKADLVLTSLADDAALRDVYTGDAAIIEGLEKGQIAVDTSTVDPETIDELGRAIDSAGAHLLDCPVSGSVSMVESGALTIMAGGDADLVDRVEPVLATMAKQIIHIGPRGTGAATKLAVNALVHGLNVALAEALVLAERAGVPRETAYEVFSSGAGGAPFVEYKRAAYLDPADAPVAFSLDLVAKDLELITGLGRRVGAPMSQAEAGLDLVNQAIKAGLSDRDLSAIAVFLREKAG